jgi:hypothetical protein
MDTQKIEVTRELYFSFFEEQEKGYRVLDNQTKKIIDQSIFTLDSFKQYQQKQDTSIFIRQYEDAVDGKPQFAKHFFIDIDYKLNPNLELLKTLPAFTMYCATGGGYHLYWKTELEHPVVDLCKVGKYIAKLVSADHKCNNPSRVLRSGGTYTKQNDIVVVKQARVGQNILPTERFNKLLEEAGRFEESCAVDNGSDESIVGTEIKVTKFKKIPIEYRDVILNGPSELYLDKFSHDLSSFDWHIINKLKEFGYSKEEIKWIFTNEKFGITINNKRKSNYEYYINRTLNRAFSL